MKKILIAEDIYSSIEEEQSFFKRSDIRIFTSVTNAGLLDIHRAEKADVIITSLDSPAMNAEDLCSIIRDDRELCRVSIIIAHNGTREEAERVSVCRANAFVTVPVQPAVLFDKTQHLLNVSKREFFRAPLGVRIDGEYMNKPFLCFSENISASGMLIETERALEKGERLLCSFLVPDWGRITVAAEVVRVAEKKTEYDSNKYGVRFVDIKAELRSAIEVFVKGKSG